jgi:arylsulfatase A-like enzyme
MAVELLRKNFGGSPGSGLSGVIPSTNLLSPGTAWVADATAPFPLNATVTVRDGAIHPTLGSGPVASRAFTITEPIGTPNLVIFVADDVGIGDLHCYGGTTIATPTLDSLAYDGIRFTQFTTTGPGNAASQYALLTGRVAARSGMGSSVAPNASGWQAEEWTLAELLRRQGYSTAFIGEWHLGNANGSHPNDQGFQLFHGLPYAMAGNPPLEENRQVLDPGPDSALLLSGLTTRAKSYIAAASEPFALVFQAPALPATGTSIAGTHGNRVEALDSAVGEILTELDSRGLADNTLVIFVGDGGAARTADGGSNGMLRDGAGTSWEGGLRAPLIARLPGTMPPGQINLSLLWLPDLMPTLASLTGGVPASDRPLDGSPHTAVLKGMQTRPAGDEIVYGFRYEGNAWKLTTVRQGKWKCHLSIVNIDPLNGNPTTGSHLYDLHIDAEERINRASGQPAIVTQLQNLATTYGASLPAAP